jgi:tyramine---L-glutamate ligase
MHIFLYEWITGGGLVEDTGTLPPTLLAEGTAMVQALASDLAAMDDCRVTTLRDVRLTEMASGRWETVEIHSRCEHQEEIARLACQADYTLIIAPEFDDLLLKIVREVVGHGGCLLSAGERLVNLAADKHRTSRQLARAGILVPEAIRLDADEEKLPGDFSYPAVLKPVCGAGSQHTLLVASPKDEPPPYPWPRRLERYYPGIAASVSFLCGPGGMQSLPPCHQHLSTDGRFTYKGGSLIDDPLLAARATALAQRALDAMPAPHGFVGIDLLLENAGDGSGDLVIEINPRLTTSYIGLRTAANGNLAQAMVEVACGRAANLSFSDQPLQFTAAGYVRQ